MTDSNNYIETDEEREEGHVNTREGNFGCEDKDVHLGCEFCETANLAMSSTLNQPILGQIRKWLCLINFN